MSRSSFEPDVERAPEPPPATPEPDLGKLGAALREGADTRSLAITGLFVLALLYTIYFARAFLLPIVLAVLLDFLLSPLIRTLKRLRIPEPVSAGLVILALLGTVGFGAYSLAGPARQWVARAPEGLRHVQERLRELRRPVEQVTRTAEQVERAATPVRDRTAQEVVVRGPSLSARLFGTTQSIVTAAIEVIILLYFLLAAGDLFLQKLIKVLPQFRDKKRAVTIARETEASISTYLFTVTAVNLGEGLAVGIAMALLGLPNPVLWGVVAGLVEFVPYLGATAMTLLLGLVGISTFDSLGHGLLVPGVYLAINFVQSNFVSPMVLGSRLTLNPVAILIGLVFWWWVWGIPGAFIAVPLLATFKIFCDHIEALAPIGEFLGR